MPRSAAAPVIVLPNPAAEEGRFHALERLYRRRDAVDALIRSLEEYEDAAECAPCVPISVAARKCS